MTRTSLFKFLDTNQNMEHTPIFQYPDWFADWKKRIQSTQIKAALQVNRELLLLYWELGRDIADKQKTTAWGEGLNPRFAKDLKAAGWPLDLRQQRK